MASKNGSSARKRDDFILTKKTPPRKEFYFYLGGELHQHIHIDRGADIITCWNHKQKKRTAYSWSETRRKMKPCYRTGQVAKMINRSRVSIENAILRGDIPKPFQAESPSSQRSARFAWTESDIMEARDFFATQHKGFPRKDGLITAKPIPTKVELRAMMEHGTVTYVRTSDGEFIPTFKEIVW